MHKNMRLYTACHKASMELRACGQHRPEEGACVCIESLLTDKQTAVTFLCCWHHILR